MCYRGVDRHVLGEDSGLGALKARDPVSGWDLVELVQPLIGVSAWRKQYLVCSRMLGISLGEYLRQGISLFCRMCSKSSLSQKSSLWVGKMAKTVKCLLHLLRA